MGEIERRVLDALQQHLLSPEAVALDVERYRAERQRIARESAQTQRDVERELAETRRRIAVVIDAIETGADLSPLVERLNTLDRRRRELEASLPAKSAAAAISLHPQAADRYRQKVAEIHEALARGDAAGQEAVARVRDLIREIRITPTPRPDPVVMEVYGDLAAMLDAPARTPGELYSDTGGCGGRI